MLDGCLSQSFALAFKDGLRGSGLMFPFYNDLTS
jgi:hypothetical protein